MLIHNLIGNFLKVDASSMDTIQGRREKGGRGGGRGEERGKGREEGEGREGGREGEGLQITERERGRERIGREGWEGGMGGREGEVWDGVEMKGI